jgi:hypothetical protein
VVLAQAEQARDHLGAEAGGRAEPRGLRRCGERLRLALEPERCDQARVEVLHRQLHLRTCDRCGCEADAGEELAQLAAGDGVVGAEGGGILPEQADLGRGPRDRLRGQRGAGGDQGEEQREEEAAAHAYPIGRLALGFRLRAVELEIRPSPEPAVRDAIRRAVASNRLLLAHPAYRSRWRLAGLRYATARPRRSRGATRA